MTTKVTMPQLGESVVEGTVGRWLVEAGQQVEKDQPLVEILTDKADSEIPAPVSGVVTQLMADADATVAVGDTLCEIDEKGTATAGASKPAASSNGAQSETSASASDEALASPSARKLARENSVDLAKVSGTGQGGRITKGDVEKAIAKTPEKPAAPAAAAPPKAPAPAAPRPSATGSSTGAFRVPPYVPQPGDEVVPFSRRRRIIADHMVYSKQTSPDVVTFAECDIQKTMKLREQHKTQLKKEGVNLTFLAFVCAAVSRALREFPEVNARVLDDAYVKLRNINLGVAVDTPDGLVVPVIRNSDELTVRGLARAIDEIALRARSGSLTPDDLAGKTFTISNPGRKGNLVGGAIISQPNVGILRLGTAKKRVVVVEHEGEDLLAIHPVMQMALSYDHRIVDGVHANGFLYRISELLEEGDFEV